MGRISVFFCACGLGFIMNDFFLASNRTVTIHGIEIKQISVKDFDLWCQSAEPIKQFLEDTEYSNENLQDLFVQHAGDVLKSLALIMDRTPDLLLDLATKQDVFLQFVWAMLQINEPYFKPEKHKKTNAKDDSTWFDSFQVLISAGHTHSEIMNMSYGAFLQYLKSVTKDQKHQVQRLRFAQHADAKAFKKYASD
ncbi:hypothetical protein AMD27_08320 [Acinetobacter sp. TGL-Y2]|nr:hypothetical protein AMD27_08320 [Acinetobacter sp. TGL-Y2]